jgi:aspartate carbamoyltransferase catalytic subunit
MTAAPGHSERAARALQGWTHRHMLDVDHLHAGELVAVMEHADRMRVRRADGSGRDLAGTTIATLFAEASTRTRVSFELAARALGGEVVSLDAATSSLVKGESLIDTVRTLESLGARTLVVRHPRSGAAQLAAEHFSGHVVNAGDGWHAHPTQALLDLYTLRADLGSRLPGAKVTIVGDVLHSRVARSNIWSLTAMGVDLWLTGPAVFLRGFEAWARALPAGRRLTVTGDLDAGLQDAAAVMALRVQRERLEGAGAPSEAAYAARWGLTEDRLLARCPAAIVMHPGPVNEGVELTPDVASGPRSRVGRQVANGVPVRMAVLSLLASTDRGSGRVPRGHRPAEAPTGPAGG